MMLLFFSTLAAERSVIYLRLTDALTLDPGKVEDMYSQEVISNVCEGLVSLNRERMAVEPCLAERWLSHENGKRWIFHLRHGVTFHNGMEFNAQAVVYSFKKRLEKKSGEYSSFGSFFPYITDVRVIDQWTVEFILSRPYAPFIFPLVDMRAAIVAPGACDGPEFQPIGTGPYIFSNWVKGKSLVLVRNPGYWQRRVQIAKLIFKCEKNDALRLTQIKNGRADIDLISSAKEYDEVCGKVDIAFLSQPKLSTHYLGFNCKRQPFSSLKARKAFAYLLDKKVLVKQIFQNYAIAAAGILPPSMPGFDAQLGLTDFSPEKARSLMHEAGLGNGFSCSLYFPEGLFGIEEVARTIAANARLIKISVKNVELPFSQILKAVQNGEPDLFLLAWGNTGDPGVFMNPLFMLYPGGNENTMSASPEFVRLLTLAEEALDEKASGQLYAAAQRQLQEDLPLIPLFYLNQLLAYNQRLHNLHMNPFGFLIFKDASLAAE
jgi:peptide/nickel transport system substrate-binding protein